MAEADILVSPRIQGVNTPMKIYSYLQAGKPILATDIFSHSQVLSPDFSFLVPPEPEAFASAMARLASDPVLRANLGRRALHVARTRYSPENFEKTASAFCDLVERLLAEDKHPTSCARHRYNEGSS
jgi:glycosyltransferase involved in cell wall biosynthesis